MTENIARTAWSGQCVTAGRPPYCADPLATDGTNHNKVCRSMAVTPASRTFFTTPVLSPLLRGLSLVLLKLLGWRVEGVLPADVKKCVMIAAPHTSNWDLPFTLMTAFALRLDIRWVGKEELFRAPFGGVMRWMGGIPVVRNRNANQVQASVDTFAQREKLILLVPPTGTRNKVTEWKTGFYWIAHGAGVPVMRGFLDWGRRRAGIGPMFQPTGDIERDMAEIRAFYAPMRGRNH
jgi:1-acyl-sn-glycerol-3-phosphate acyltransferase